MEELEQYTSKNKCTDNSRIIKRGFKGKRQNPGEENNQERKGLQMKLVVKLLLLGRMRM